MIRKISELSLLTSDTPFQAPVYYKERTSSTMKDAAELIKLGGTHGTVIRAGHQTNGRGRLTGRVWTDLPDTNLLFTIILEQNTFKGIPLPLSLLMGWALYRFFKEKLSVPAEIKWPNDLLVGGRKISGILCESFGKFYLSGVGVNLNQTDFSGDYTRPPVSLKLLTGRTYNPDDILLSFLDILALVLEFPPDHADLETALYGRAATVRVLLGHPEGKQILEGRIDGLQQDGALLLRVEGKKDLFPVYSGEIIYDFVSD